MIEKSMEQKQEIEQQLEDIREYHKEQIIQARNEAQAILATAQENAEKERSVQLVKAQKEINALFEKANKDIEAQKQEMLKNVETRIAEILIPALERVLQESVDDKNSRTTLSKVGTKNKRVVSTIVICPTLHYNTRPPCLNWNKHKQKSNKSKPCKLCSNTLPTLNNKVLCVTL